jgi:hypothetical protein
MRHPLRAPVTSLLLSLAAAPGAAGQIQPILTVASFAEYECFGTIVARAGDADGDGRPDLLIGDRRSTATVVQNTMFVVDGDNGDIEGSYGIGDVDGTSDCALLRPWRISIGRDRDGDGIRDLLVGYPGLGTGPAGSALALSGRDGSIQLAFVTERMSVGDRYGSGVTEHGSSIGSDDPDVVVAAPGEDAFGNGAGALFVFDGVTGDTAQFGPLGRPGEGPSGFGDSLWPVGDTDADGRQDFVVVQQGERPPGDDRSAHRVYAYSGALPSFRFELYPSNTRSGTGTFGDTVAPVPDLNGDGRDEILIGDMNSLAQTHVWVTGRAWLIDGASGALMDSLDIPNPAGNLSAHMGRSVTALGDVNGDGLPELVVGAPGYDSGSEHPTHPTAMNNGRVFIYDGATRDLIFTLRSPNEAGQEDHAFFGTSVADAGDIDGDGRPELVVGAPGELLTAGPAPSGRVYVFSLPPVSPTQPGPREAGLRLMAPRPHPIRERGAIDYELAEAGHVRLTLVDILGREVMVLIDARMAAGLHSAQIDASDVRPGTYMARLDMGGATVGRRVTLVR